MFSDTKHNARDKMYNDHQHKIAYPAYPAGFRLKPSFTGTYFYRLKL